LEDNHEYDDCPTFCKYSKRRWVLERTEYCDECKFTTQRRLFDRQFRLHIEEKFGEEVAREYDPAEFRNTVRAVVSVLESPNDQISYKMSVLRATYSSERETFRELEKPSAK
jgi:hypothetical protein